MSAAVRGSRLAHAHVQRAVLHHRKAALRRVQLVGGNPDVEQSSADRGQAQLIQYLVGIFKIRLHQMQPVGKGSQPLAALRQRIVVLIQRHDFRAMLQKPLGVASATGRAIEQNESRRRAQQRHHLVGHHGYVIAHGVLRLFQGLQRLVFVIPGFHMRCVGGF